tara:strand:- start:910 stop:1323 length:414 start_codon:yes stop_codon:yes gene_type:complete
MTKKFEIPKKDPFILNSKNLKNFKKKCKNKKTGYRVLCHYKPEKKLHQMLINHKKNALIKVHKNEKSPKSYFMIEGTMEIYFFKKDIRDKKKVRLSSKVRFVRLEKNWFHYIKIISKNVIFIETILGPHKKTKFYDF